MCKPSAAIAIVIQSSWTLAHIAADSWFFRYDTVFSSAHYPAIEWSTPFEDFVLHHAMDVSFLAVWQR